MSEFAELLDLSTIKAVLGVDEDIRRLPVLPGSWRECAKATATAGGCLKVVHGGGLDCVSRFVTGVQGYHIKEAGTLECEGMWFSPCSATRAFEAITDLYGWRHSPLFFDKPVVVVAAVDPSALNRTANDSYEKVLPLNKAGLLSAIQVFEPELKPDDAGDFYPFGARFNPDFTADFAYRIAGVSPLLSGKLSKWRINV
jgi:hypothetical protein